MGRGVRGGAWWVGVRGGRVRGWVGRRAGGRVRGRVCGCVGVWVLGVWSEGAYVQNLFAKVLSFHVQVTGYTSADTLQHNMLFLDLRAPVKSQRWMLESTYKCQTLPKTAGAVRSDF